MAGAGENQYLTFFLGEEECAIPVLRAREIVEYGAVTRLPSAPPWIRGVINLRGIVVPVVDLATKFALRATPPGRRACVVLVECALGGEVEAIGVVADAVSQVVELPAAEIEPPPAFGTRLRVDFLLGMGRAGRKFLLVLDIDRVLSAPELLFARGLAQAAPAAEAGGARGGHDAAGERPTTDG